MDIDVASQLQDWSPRRKALPAELADGLAARIHAGELTAGTKLPSEPRLAENLGVSRNTVREAIGILREQGLVATRQGLGTVVLDPDSAAEWPVEVGIERLMSTTELITRAGHKPGTRSTETAVVRGEKEALAHLQLPPTELLQCVERVRTADEIPVLYIRDFVSTELVPDRILAQYRGDGSIFAFLQRELGLDVIAARADILPVLPTARVASLLGVSRRRPLLVLHQVHYGRDHRPFLYSENHFNPEYIGIHVRRAVASPTTRPPTRRQT